MCTFNRVPAGVFVRVKSVDLVPRLCDDLTFPERGPVGLGEIPLRILSALCGV